MKNKKIFKAFFLVCLIILTTLACQSQGESTELPGEVLPTKTPPPAIPPTSTHNPIPPIDATPTHSPTVVLPSPTSTPVPLPLGVVIPHLNPGDDVIISYIEMFTQTEGWGIGGTQDPGDHILRTTDGGNTWIDVTPPEPIPNVGDSDKEAMAFFLDTNTAWVTYAPQGTFSIPDTPFIWYTTDGGQSWGASPPLNTQGMMESYFPLFLLFADEYTGWFMVSVGAGMSHQYTMVYKTQNGGVSWEKIHDPMSSTHLQSCCKTGLAFADTQTGLVTTDQGAYASPYVEWTHDGGLTWEHQSLPPLTNNPDMFNNSYCEGHSPHLFSPQSAMLALECKNYGTDTTSAYIYITKNGGAVWYAYEYPGGELIFFDSVLGYALTREIYKTSDGGQNWTHVRTVYWDGQFSFINPNLVWAVVRSDEGIALVYSTNGTEYWNEIMAVIEE